MQALPNQAASDYLNDPNLLALVNNEAVECTQIAQAIQDSAGGAGHQITVNPAPGAGGAVHWPTRAGPASGNYHTVYSDGSFVFDPRYRLTPIPLAQWEAEVHSLNGGANVFGR